MTADPDTDPRVLRSRAVQQPEPLPSARQTANSTDPARAAAERLRARETLIERIIRDAQAAGHFDDLPHRGERLPLVDDRAAGDMAAAFRILRNAEAAPQWIETDKDIRRLLAERDAILDRAGRAGPMSRDRYRAQIRALVSDVNRLVFVLSHEAPTMNQHRRPLDLDAELAVLERRWPS